MVEGVNWDLTLIYPVLLDTWLQTVDNANCISETVFTWLMNSLPLHCTSLQTHSITFSIPVYSFFL
jgi:hypothetical protein